MSNTKQIIDSHNKKILKTHNNNNNNINNKKPDKKTIKRATAGRKTHALSLETAYSHQLFTKPLSPARIIKLRKHTLD